MGFHKGTSGTQRQGEQPHTTLGYASPPPEAIIHSRQVSLRRENGHSAGVGLYFILCECLLKCFANFDVRILDGFFPDQCQGTGKRRAASIPSRARIPPASALSRKNFHRPGPAAEYRFRRW